jgi:hypothetical protein
MDVADVAAAAAVAAADVFAGVAAAYKVLI